MKLKNEDKIYVVIVVLIIATLISLGIVALALSITGVVDVSKDFKEASKTECMFERVGFGTRASEEIVYDKKTKVMYINDSSGRYSVIVNPDGTPRLYEEE